MAPGQNDPDAVVFRRWPRLIRVAKGRTFAAAGAGGGLNFAVFFPREALHSEPAARVASVRRRCCGGGLAAAEEAVATADSAAKLPRSC